MQYHLKTKIFSNQRSVVEKHGDALWDTLCDFVFGPSFTMSDCAAVIVREHGYAPSTARQYAKVIIANVRAESGDEVIRRNGNMYRWV